MKKPSLNLLQLYRGLASILVVLSHANILLGRELKQDGLLEIFHFGWVGVDFFFVLSGFIIFYVHQSDIGQSSQFKSFVSKRFFRIYPLYWIILTSKIVVSLFGANNNSIYQSSLSQIVKVILLIPQDRANLENFIGVSWTLSYEIFFYFLFGLLILIKPKICRPIFIVWIVGLLLNFFSLLPIKDSFLLKFIFDAHNLEFILGCLAAYIVSKYEIKYAMLLTYSSLAMLVLSVINTKYPDFDVSGISSVIAYGIPFTLLIISSVYIERTASVKINPILIYLGNASYSIYLTHSFFINNIAKIFVKTAEKWNLNLLLLPPNSALSIMLVSIIVILSIMMGCVVYSCLEQPLMTRLRKKQSPKLV